MDGVFGANDVWLLLLFPTVLSLDMDFEFPWVSLPFTKSKHVHFSLKESAEPYDKLTCSIILKCLLCVSHSLTRNPLALQGCQYFSAKRAYSLRTDLHVQIAASFVVCTLTQALRRTYLVYGRYAYNNHRNFIRNYDNNNSNSFRVPYWKLVSDQIYRGSWASGALHAIPTFQPCFSVKSPASAPVKTSIQTAVGVLATHQDIISNCANRPTFTTSIIHS